MKKDYDDIIMKAAWFIMTPFLVIALCWAFLVLREIAVRLSEEIIWSVK